jgi:hypothetical protein
MTTTSSSSSSSSTTMETNTASQFRKYPILSPSTHLQIKLTKDNYLSWKTAILPYINGNNILHHIDGSAPAPPITIPPLPPLSSFPTPSIPYGLKLINYFSVS